MNILAAVFFVVMGISFLAGLITDDSDKDFWHRSGLQINTDYKTGYQYLSKFGGLTPRLDANGNHMKIDLSKDALNEK